MTDFHTTFFLDADGTHEDAMTRARREAADFYGDTPHEVAVSVEAVRTIGNKVSHYEVDVYAREER